MDGQSEPLRREEGVPHSQSRACIFKYSVMYVGCNRAGSNANQPGAKCESVKCK